MSRNRDSVRVQGTDHQNWVIVETHSSVNIYHFDRREAQLFRVWIGIKNKKILTGRRIPPPKNRDFTPFKKEELQELVDALSEVIKNE